MENYTERVEKYLDFLNICGKLMKNYGRLRDIWI